MVAGSTCLLVRHSLCGVAHQLLDVLHLHLRVELLEHRVSLLDAEEYILLDQRELDRGYLRRGAVR